MFRFLFLFLFLPSLLYPQQTNSSAANSSTTQPPTEVANSAPEPSKTPGEFFARARQLSDLEAAGIPFHLKATFVAAGDTEFTGKGTYEEWWQSDNTWRKEATLGNYKWVSIAMGAERTVYASSGYNPLRLRQTIDAVLIQFPSVKNADGEYQINHKVLNKIDFTVLTKPLHTKPDNPGNLFESYYFSPAGALQIIEIGDLATFYNRFQPFQNVVIPRKINIALGKDQLLVISIDTLEPLQQAATTISAVPALPEDMSWSEPRINAPARVKPPKLIYSPTPIYPFAAKNHGMQGTVVLGAIINDDGKVREPYVLLSAGDLLDNAALESVRNWRYQPTTLDGKPVAVETRISVVFALDRSH